MMINELKHDTMQDKSTVATFSDYLLVTNASIADSYIGSAKVFREKKSNNHKKSKRFLV